MLHRFEMRGGGINTSGVENRSQISPFDPRKITAAVGEIAEWEFSALSTAEPLEYISRGRSLNGLKG